MITRILIYLSLAFVVAHVRNRNNPPVIYVDNMPFSWGPSRGACLAPFCILVRRAPDQDVVLRHEMCHWNQYYKLGIPGFYLKYIYQYLTLGYNAMPLERECRFEESPACQADYLSCYYR